MDVDGSTNGSFRAPYYRSADYQTRYPAYLRLVAAPPPVTANFQSALHPRRFGVRKMATCNDNGGGYRPESSKRVGFADSVSFESSAAAAAISAKRKSTRKKRRRSRKSAAAAAELATADDPVIEPPPYSFHPPPVEDDHSLRDHNIIASYSEPLLTAAEQYSARSHHTLTSTPVGDSTSRPSCLLHSFPTKEDEEEAAHPITDTFHGDLIPHRRRAGQEDNQLRDLTPSTISVPLLPLPPTADEYDFPLRGFTPLSTAVRSTPPPPPPPPPPLRPASGDGQLHPIELLKQTATRFKLECERRRRTTDVQHEKAQARNIAEQAKRVVMEAKRGWSYGRDDHKGAGTVVWSDDDDDDDEPSTAGVVRLPEYAELERLGLGKYDSGGRWVPSSNRLRNRFLGSGKRK